MNKINDCTDILFLDIETVPQFPAFEDTPEEIKSLWTHKAQQLKKLPDEQPADLYKRAGIYAEFGKIVCISTGIVRINEDETSLRIKSFSNDDETVLLMEFALLLHTYFSKPGIRLCAHNGKEFDFPYISRRMVINQLPLPEILNTAGKKPWEINHLDTMELWKFGDYKSYTPLKLLAFVLDIPSPKNDIDGSQVWSVYWNDKNLSRIVKYCEKDVEALVNVYMKMKGIPVISENSITSV